MTIRSRRQLLLLIALLIVGAVILTLQLRPAPAGAADTPAPTRAGVQQTQQDNAVGDVNLESLEHRDDTLATPSRDVFQFQSRRSEAPEPVTSRPQAPADEAPPEPVGPPPPPPIPLRYIGYLEQPQLPRVAVLSDGRGNVFNGKEGDIIEGRYRVLRIGTDSADLIYVDGRGRQTIRLSGQ